MGDGARAERLSPTAEHRVRPIRQGDTYEVSHHARHCNCGVRRRGPQALSLKIIDSPPSLAKTRREAAAAEHKHTPDELHGMVEDMITLLESAVQPELRKGKYPDRKVARRVSEVVRAVASELDA